MTDQGCKDPCQSGAKAPGLAVSQLLFTIFSVALLTLTQPIESWSQKPKPSGRSRQKSQTGATSARPSDWLQWGGPGRDFVAPATELLSSWPAGGPRRLWSRKFGDGYSAIAVDGTRLYTAYQRDSQEVVIAIDARSGKTLWEYAYETVIGDGPSAMPQIIGDRLVTASTIGQIHSLDKKTGKVVWSRDLYKEF